MMTVVAERVRSGRTSVRRGWAGFAVAVTALAVLTACSGDDEPPVPAVQEPISACHQDGEREVTVPGPQGESTFAVGVGKGTRAVLLLHEAESDHCTWIDFARRLALNGVQAWAVDSSASSSSHSKGGSDPTTDLVRMAEYVRAHGASEVVVAGASMGGTAAMAVAGPVRAVRVATLSAPDIYNGADAAGGARALTVPALVVVGQTDIEFVPAAQQFAAENRAHVKLLVVPSGAHGTSLLSRDSTTDPSSPTVSEVLLEFLLA